MPGRLPRRGGQDAHAGEPLRRLSVTCRVAASDSWYVNAIARRPFAGAPIRTFLKHRPLAFKPIRRPRARGFWPGPPPPPEPGLSGRLPQLLARTNVSRPEDVLPLMSVAVQRNV